MKEKTKIDFNKIWQETKEQLVQLSKDTTDFLKRGEEEISKVSGQAKKNFENMVLKLKKEQLFYFVGKEAYKLLKNKRVPKASLKKLIEEVKNIDKQIRIK
jgi:vacuolar-type H+-ATPase subunit H